jgi:glycosyltransferase involved in cell wall biosynthesis
MKVLGIGYGRNLFDQQNFEYERLNRCAGEVESFDQIIFALASAGLTTRTSEQGFTLHPTNSKHKLLMLFDAIKLGNKLIEQKQIDVITAQDVFETGLVGLVLKWRHPHLTLQVQEHGDVLSSEHWRKEKITNQLRYYFARFLLKKADVVRVVSERTKSYVQPLLKPGTTLHKLPVVIDTNLFTNLPTKVSRREDTTFTFITAARFVPQKNFSLMLRAFATAHNALPHLRLRIFGEGPQETEIRALIKTLALESVVELHGWSKDIATDMASADAYLLSSNYEGWARVLIEAMLVGIPIVTTDVGCAHEVVKAGEHGLIVPVGDEEALSSAIQQLASDSALYERLSEHLRQLQINDLPGTDLNSYATAWAQTLR